MVSSIDDVLDNSQTIVIGNKSKEFATVPDRIHGGQTIIDLVRIKEELPRSKQYKGICW